MLSGQGQGSKGPTNRRDKFGSKRSSLDRGKKTSITHAHDILHLQRGPPTLEHSLDLNRERNIFDFQPISYVKTDEDLSSTLEQINEKHFGRNREERRSAQFGDHLKADLYPVLEANLNASHTG